MRLSVFHQTPDLDPSSIATLLIARSFHRHSTVDPRKSSICHPPVLCRILVTMAPNKDARRADLSESLPPGGFANSPSCRTPDC